MNLEGEQAVIERYFDAGSQGWRSVYFERSVPGAIYRERLATALSWIDSLGLMPGACVLEIGCGAGLLASALAERGFDVTAVDATQAMVDLTERLVRDRGLGTSLHVARADAHELPFPDSTFALVVALGVIPYLHSPDLAVAEIVRVLQPAGYFLASNDNALRLNHLLDPRLSPLLSRVRWFVGRGLRRTGILGRRASIPGRLGLPRDFRGLLESAALRQVRETTLGFGPLSYWLRPMFSDQDGVRLHRAIQNRADRGMPVLRSLGAHHLILAQRRPIAGSRESHGVPVETLPGPGPAGSR